MLFYLKALHVLAKNMPFFGNFALYDAGQWKSDQLHIFKHPFPRSSEFRVKAVLPSR